MSKSDGRKFFQPIPLSSILDPTYQSPFSKLQQFQVDMDITSSRMCHHHQHHQPRPSVWRKLQSTLMSAISNLVVISQPVFSAHVMSRSSSMTLVPWKSYKTCDLLMSDCGEDADFVKTPTAENKKTGTEPPSLYYSIRSGLQCLRHFATHPLSHEEIRRQSPGQGHPEQDCKQTNIVPQPIGKSIAGGAFFFPLYSEPPSCALSAPTTPTHHRIQAQFQLPNLFCLAMGGVLISSPQGQDPINTFYKNCCLFSPMHYKGQRSMSTPATPLRSRSLGSTPATSPSSETGIEIIFHSVSTSQEQFCPKFSGSSSPTPVPQPTPDVSKSVSTGSGCIRIETNWRSKGGKNRVSDEAGLVAMSVCSSTSTSKSGTVTFSCSSTVSTSPKAMATSYPRRRKTESESSTDSFIEFSASVESADSFCIVFEPVGGSIDEEVMSREDEEDEEWQDDDSEEDESDEDDDQVFNYGAGATDDLFMDGVIFQGDGIDCGDQVDFCFQPDLMRKKKMKNVSFNEEQLENVIEFDDDSDSKSARETYWEMLARDRTRFQDRVYRTGDILEPILQPDHRCKVFQQRFSSEN